jgi:hypothetical protein
LGGRDEENIIDLKPPTAETLHRMETENMQQDILGGID